MCDSGTNDQKVKVFKITRPDYGKTSWVSPDWDIIKDAEFDGMEVGDKIGIEVVEMTQHELENLKDFEGW